MSDAFLTRKLEQLVFCRRSWVIGVFVLLTLFIGSHAARLRVDAAFTKQLPLKHEYMQTYLKYHQEFGRANQVLIALIAREGDMFTPEFFRALKEVTDAVFFIPGVDRAQVYSLFTPNVRFTEVVEDGIAGGNVVPDDFNYRPADFERVRRNILKSDIVGRLVANDFRGALVSAQLLEWNPLTKEKLNYPDVARQLENIRSAHANQNIDIHIIGFAKVIGDITSGAARVVSFFLIAFLITTLLVYVYTQSFRLTLIPLSCSLVAVVWQLGLLQLLGFGIDPLSILVPFLIFAIGVSHGVQMVSTIRAEVFFGVTSEEAARATFRRLLVPGGIALLTDMIGFLTIYFIEIPIVQELAITASLGVTVIIFTNLVLVPVLLSYLTYDDVYLNKIKVRAEHLERIWEFLAHTAEKKNAAVIIAVSVALFFLGAWRAGHVAIGDLQWGVPELRDSSRYNQDSRAIGAHFSIGVDVISVISETTPEGCVDYEVMRTIDRFVGHMKNVPGVQSVMSLSEAAKIINAGWNEGSLKWRVIPRNPETMAQAVAYVPTSSGLLNTECSVMPVLIFTADHKAETIARVVAAVKSFRSQNPSDKVKFQLATGNVGVMAATNEEVAASQFPILMYVWGAVIALCLITFWSIRGSLCIIIPLGLVSLLAYSLMYVKQIGLKTSTLPVVALGVGIGVDYGIYIYSRLRSFIKEGIAPRELDLCNVSCFRTYNHLEDDTLTLPLAYLCTLRITGSGVIFTGATLAIGVATWIFSPLKFQADMGLLLTFMFLLNMLGAILLLPALACWLFPTMAKPGVSPREEPRAGGTVLKQ
jgi:uncharacterized protein